MNQNIFQLSPIEIGTALGIGLILGLIYIYLLWATVQTLPKVKHKGLFLFVSAFARIFLLIFGALALSDEKAGRFILIFCGVIIVRLFVLRFTKMGAYYQAEQKTIAKTIHSSSKKTSKSKKRTSDKGGHSK